MVATNSQTRKHPRFRVMGMGREWHANIYGSVTLTQATSGDTPAARDGHCAAYDAPAHRLVVFGGRGADRRRLNDVHHLDLATWAWKRVITDGVGGCSGAG